MRLIPKACTNNNKPLIPNIPIQQKLFLWHLKEISCSNGTLNDSCGPYSDVLVFSISYLLGGICINILMVAGVVWNRGFFVIPWMIYQLSLSLMLILGPFFVLYYNVPDWNRYEIRNGVVNDYPERWQNMTMIAPNLSGILCLYILCHGILVFQEMTKKEQPKVEPKEPKPSIYGGPQITVYATHPDPRQSVISTTNLTEPSAPPKIIEWCVF